MRAARRGVKAARGATDSSRDGSVLARQRSAPSACDAACVSVAVRPAVPMDGDVSLGEKEIGSPGLNGNELKFGFFHTVRFWSVWYENYHATFIEYSTVRITIQEEARLVVKPQIFSRYFIKKYVAQRSTNSSSEKPCLFFLSQENFA